MRLHPLRNKRKHIMCTHPLMTTWQLTYFRSLKNYHVLVCGGGGFFLGTNHGRRFVFPLTHIWLIGSEALPCPYHLVMIEMIERGEGETASPTSTILYFLLTTIVC